MLILLAPLFTTNPRFVVQWGELGLATPTECRQVAWVQTPAHQIELIMGRWDLDCWNQMWVWLKSWLVGELYFLSNYRCVECQMLKTSPPFKNCAQKRNNKGKLLAVSICLAVCLFVCLFVWCVGDGPFRFSAMIDEPPVAQDCVPFHHDWVKKILQH